VFVVFSPLSLPLVWRGFLNASEERGGGLPKLLAMSRKNGAHSSRDKFRAARPGAAGAHAR